MLLIFTVACNNNGNVAVNETSAPVIPSAEVSGGGRTDSTPSGAGSAFNNYAGPVLPLSVVDTMEEIAMSRNVYFDFSGFSRVPNGRFDYGNIKITDKYTLANGSVSDVTARILYPFISDFTKLSGQLPVITLPGAELETGLIAGAYSGGFISWDGTDSVAANPKRVDSWEGYASLLSDGDYVNRAFEEASSLNQSVTVYEFSNARNDSSAPAVAPTLAASFSLDNSKTKVHTYFFNGTESDAGYMRQSFFIPEEWHYHFGLSRYMIVFGDDISDLTIQGYKDGGCRKGEELDGVKADISRYEMEFGDILAIMLEDFMQLYYDGRVADSLYFNKEYIIDPMLIYKAAVDHMFDYGILAHNIAWRYDMGMGLYDFFVDVLALERVFFLVADVVIPAGEDIELKVDMIKPGSFNLPGFGLDNLDTYGYDIMTQIGSGQIPNSLTLWFIGAEYVDILSQNLSFDTKSESSSITVDPNVPHYFLNICRRNT